MVRGRRPVTVAVAVLLTLAACTSDASPHRKKSTGAGPSASPLLGACPLRGDLRCGSIEVPLDRANLGAGMISISFSVHTHTDTESPAGEPVFAVPGGPGSPGIEAMGFALGIGAIAAHHDVVAIDPRGTGASGALDCPDLQNGWNHLRELEAAVTACGEQLGDAADRYGAGDVAKDMEAVRRALGFDPIDLYAFSYGTVPEQAYAVRFPEHVNALVFDAGMAVTDPEHVWGWRLGIPGAVVRAVALMCTRDAACDVANPAAALRWLVRRVARDPIRGSVERPGGDPEIVLVGEAEVASLLQSTGTCVVCGQIDPAQVMAAVAASRRGDLDPLLRLADLYAGGPGAVARDPSDFSAGDNIAAFCNDQDFVWERTDPIDVRRRKFAAALRDLPPQAFEPYSRDGWNGFTSPGACLTWPAPDLFEPAVPADAEFPDVPTLILAGDSDTIVPPVVVETLHEEFPNATFVTVAGAAHPVTGPAWGDCAAELVGRLFDTLAVGDTSCAQTPE